MDKPPVIAAIDVGTNSFHMAIASVNSKAMMNVLNREKEIVRLGSGSGDMKIITPDAIDRGVTILRHYSEIAKTENAEIHAVATSAVREADNKDEFLNRVKSETGITVQVVSGYEEGRLIYLGALHALPIYNKRTLLIDIGGGSTETVVGFKGKTEYVHSAKIGSIRITKRFFDGDSDNNENNNGDKNGDKNSHAIESCREFIKGEWSPILHRISEMDFDTVVATSGTLQTLAVMTLAAKGISIPEIINGLTVSAKNILKVIDRIISAGTRKKRAALPGMDPSRADIILGGALIIERAIKTLKIKKFTISSYALREGIIFDIAQKQKNIGETKHLSHLRYQTIYNLCSRYNIEMKHAEFVKNTALSIFDGLRQLHNMSIYERELLESAALLHDVGYLISHDLHHKHSYYIIMHSMMPGFTNNEAELIANIARYHRKSHPKKKHGNFVNFSDRKKNIIRTLAGILRIAEGMDRRQLQVIENIDTEIFEDRINILIKPTANFNTDIELWGAVRRKFLLEEIIKRKIIIKIM